MARSTEEKSKLRWPGGVADAIWATACESGLMLLAGAVALGSGYPMIFASLGPTAYEQTEMPHLNSARPYNVIVGHLIGLGSGFLALWLLHSWYAPAVDGGTYVSGLRLWSAVLAVLFTSVGTLTLNARQPAAMATALLVGLGAYQGARGALALIFGVVLLALAGEPLRRIRLLKPKPAEGTLAPLVQ